MHNRNETTAVTICFQAQQKCFSFYYMFSCITETFFVWLYVFGYNHHFVFQLLAISTIFCHKFATYNNQFSILFVHYVDHIYPNLCITLTRFPQSTENTYICGIQFQISPIILWDVFQFGVYCKFTIKSELEYILMWLWIIWFQISPNLCSFWNDL